MWAWLKSMLKETAPSAGHPEVFKAAVRDMSLNSFVLLSLTFSLLHKNYSLNLKEDDGLL